MCDPVTISIVATSVLSVGSAVASADAQRSQNFQNKKSSRDALSINNRDISLRALQERIAAAQESQGLDEQARDATGLTTASAAGGNVGGMTVDMLLQDIENTRLGGQDAIALQAKANQDALTRERSGALATSRNRDAQTSRPNPFAVGLRIAGGVTDAYTSYRATQPKITPAVIK